MNYDAMFQSALDGLHADGSYRYFADLERRAGNFPRHSIMAWAVMSRSGAPTTISGWGSTPKS